MDTKKLRQKILDLAIRGKLVPQDPNDEPASVLLERIRAEKERLIAEGKIKRSKKSATSDTPHYENVPDSWCIVPLGNVCILNEGEPIADREYPYIDVKGLRTGDYASRQSGKYIPAGTTLILVDGENSGEVFHIPLEGYQGSTMKVLDIDRNMNAQYVLYFVKLYQKALRENKVGSAIPHLNKKMFRELIIPIPPREEQNRIVSAIEQWFTLINILEDAKDDLQNLISQAKSKILDLAIRGKIVPQDPNDEPAIELLKRINSKFTPCDNAHDTNLLPNSWCWIILESIFQHNTGKALNKSDSQEGILKPYLTTSNVYWNCFNFTEVKKMYFKYSELEKCTVIKGDLLVCEGGDIGRSAIWNYDYDICIQNHIHRLRAKGEICQIFYLYVLMLYKWKNKIQGKGIGLQSLSSGSLDRLVIPLPPYQEQLRIVNKIEELFSVLDEIQKSIET